jgi:hypothetical protein
MTESGENSTAVLVVVEPNALLPSRVFKGCNGAAIAVIAGLDQETQASALARIRKRAHEFAGRGIRLKYAVLVVSVGLGGTWRRRRQAIARELAQQVPSRSAKLVVSAPGADGKLREELLTLAASLVSQRGRTSVALDFKPAGDTEVIDRLSNPEHEALMTGLAAAAERGRLGGKPGRVVAG